MALFKVISIIDGDTIRISPKWLHNNEQGDVVKILGYSTPLEPSQLAATKKLSDLLKGQLVELKNARKFNDYSESLLCSVFLKDVDISKYFPEYPSPSNWNF